jgi:hypothetical protein
MLPYLVSFFLSLNDRGGDFLVPNIRKVRSSNVPYTVPCQVRRRRSATILLGGERALVYLSAINPRATKISPSPVFFLLLVFADRVHAYTKKIG